MCDDLDIASRLEYVAGSDQPEAQLLMVVDLAVADDGHRSVLGGDRLMATSHIDDGQPGHPHGHLGRDVEPLVVGTAMMQSRDHSLRGIARSASRSERADTGDATHL